MRVGPRTWGGAATVPSAAGSWRRRRRASAFANICTPTRAHDCATSALISVARCASLAWAVGAALACRRAPGTAAMGKIVRGPGRARRYAPRATHARDWRGCRGDEWRGFVARDAARRRRKACARQLFFTARPRAARAPRCVRCPAVCDARGTRTWDAGLRLPRALRAKWHRRRRAGVRLALGLNLAADFRRELRSVGVYRPGLPLLMVVHHPGKPVIPTDVPAVATILDMHLASGHPADVGGPRAPFRRVSDDPPGGSNSPLPSKRAFLVQVT